MLSRERFFSPSDSLVIGNKEAVVLAVIQLLPVFWGVWNICLLATILENPLLYGLAAYAVFELIWIRERIKLIYTLLIIGNLICLFAADWLTTASGLAGLLFLLVDRWANPNDMIEL